MTGHISYILNADSWNLVGEYTGLAEQAHKLDKLLNDDVKSEGFKGCVQKWAGEHDRNLKIFWTSLCRASTSEYGYGGPTFQMSLRIAMNDFPRWFEESDISLVKANPGALPDTREALACIQRVVNNPRVQEHLFPKIKTLIYCGGTGDAHALPPAVELQPSFFIPEFAHLTNLTTATLNQTVYHDGMGNFITPIDFQYVPHVYNLTIKPRTDLRQTDLILTQNISIKSKWEMSEHENTQYFEKPRQPVKPLPPPPTCWESIASCFQGIFAWLCSWF